MNTTDYNKIMEFIEQNFIGQPMKVRVKRDGRDELNYRGRLEDAGYITESDALARRVSADFDGDFRLRFENLEATFSGYRLQLGTIMDYSLPNPADSKKYLLGNCLDRPILLELERE